MMIRFLALILPGVLMAQSSQEGLTFHQKPRPLPKEATTNDWPRFFGPHDNCTINEGPLLKDITKGLNPVFELERGPSYASPIISNGKLLHFHAIDGKETLDCVHPETGKRFWRFAYPFIKTATDSLRVPARAR